MTDKKQAPDELLTVEDVCKLYHIARRTLYAWIHDGKISGRKAGRRWFFTREEVESILTR